MCDSIRNVPPYPNLIINDIIGVTVRTFMSASARQGLRRVGLIQPLIGLLDGQPADGQMLTQGSRPVAVRVRGAGLCITSHHILL
jgi:hypothetical protein